MTLHIVNPPFRQKNKRKSKRNKEKIYMYMYIYIQTHKKASCGTLASVTGIGPVRLLLFNLLINSLNDKKSCVRQTDHKKQKNLPHKTKNPIKKQKNRGKKP